MLATDGDDSERASGKRGDRAAAQVKRVFAEFALDDGAITLEADVGDAEELGRLSEECGPHLDGAMGGLWIDAATVGDADDEVEVPEHLAEDARRDIADCLRRDAGGLGEGDAADREAVDLGGRVKAFGELSVYGEALAMEGSLHALLPLSSSCFADATARVPLIAAERAFSSSRNLITRSTVCWATRVEIESHIKPNQTSITRTVEVNRTTEFSATTPSIFRKASGRATRALSGMLSRSPSCRWAARRSRSTQSHDSGRRHCSNAAGTCPPIPAILCWFDANCFNISKNCSPTSPPSSMALASDNNAAVWCSKEGGVIGAGPVWSAREPLPHGLEVLAHLGEEAFKELALIGVGVGADVNALGRGRCVVGVVGVSVVELLIIDPPAHPLARAGQTLDGRHPKGEPLRLLLRINLLARVL